MSWFADREYSRDMKFTEAIPQHAESLRLAKPVLSRHDRRRLSSWRVIGSTVAGFPAFLWQLTRNIES